MHDNKGFTLIELSIVLVIIALIAGGVLVGQDLIRVAQYQQLINSMNSHVAAMYTFKDKYDYLPGDMPNATTFWGQHADCTIGVTRPPQVPTCNGDGDGYIEYAYDGPNFNYTESVTFWQHMSNAGLIKDQISPSYGCTDYCGPDGLGKSHLWAATVLSWTQYGFGFDPFGVPSNAAKGLVVLTQYIHAEGPYWMKASEALIIDTKFDDGKHNSGWITSINGGGVCVNGTGNYDPVANNNCKLYFTVVK